MNRHDLAEMAELIARLNLHFPRAGGLSNAQTAALAEDWAEDLAAYPMPVIRQAVKLCRNDGDRHWFPSVGEFKAYCATASGELERYQRRMALPAPEESMAVICERGSRHCKAILAKLRRMPFEEAG